MWEVCIHRDGLTCGVLYRHHAANSSPSRLQDGSLLLRRILKYSCVLTRRLDLGMESFISCYHWQTWVLSSSIAKHHGTSVYRWQQLQPLNPRSNLTPDKILAVTGCHLRISRQMQSTQTLRAILPRSATNSVVKLWEPLLCSCNGAACSTASWGLGFFSGALEEMAEVLDILGRRVSGLKPFQSQGFFRSFSWS